MGDSYGGGLVNERERRGGGQWRDGGGGRKGEIDDDSMST